MVHFDAAPVPMTPLRHIVQRRGALALVALALLAQQVGVPAHAAMQLRSALGGPAAEICSSSHPRGAPGESVPPSDGSVLGAGGLCDLCATATAATAANSRVPPAGSQPVVAPPDSRDAGPLHRTRSRRAHQSRAPPLPVS